MGKKQRRQDRMIRLINAETIERMGLNLKDGIRLDRQGVVLGSAKSGRGRFYRIS